MGARGRPKGIADRRYDGGCLVAIIFMGVLVILLILACKDYGVESTDNDPPGVVDSLEQVIQIQQRALYNKECIIKCFREQYPELICECGV